MKNFTVPRLSMTTKNIKNVRTFYWLLVPLVEAFALPGLVERATDAEASRKHDICNYLRCSHTTNEDITYPPTSTVASFLTNPESCEVSTSQERALSKYAFQKIRIPPHESRRDFCIAVCNYKITKKL